MELVSKGDLFPSCPWRFIYANVGLFSRAGAKEGAAEKRASDVYTLRNGEARNLKVLHLPRQKLVPRCTRPVRDALINRLPHSKFKAVILSLIYVHEVRN